MTETIVGIRTEADIVEARLEGRRMAAELKLSTSEQVLVTTAISELARNILQYAERGEIELELVTRSGRRGIRIVARDQGPGIPDVELAMMDGYSTGGGLGLGLPGSKRLMDEFDLATEVGKGTTITMTKWAR